MIFLNCGALALGPVNLYRQIHAHFGHVAGYAERCVESGHQGKGKSDNGVHFGLHGVSFGLTVSPLSAVGTDLLGLWPLAREGAMGVPVLVP